MSNKLSAAAVLTPTAGTALSTAFGAAPSNWVSQQFAAPGVPYGANEVSFMFTFAFGSSTGIEIVAEHAAPEASGVALTWFPLGRLNSSNEVENAVITLLAANATIPSQTTWDVSLIFPAGHWVRLRARALTSATNATLDVKATAGGGAQRS